MAVVREFSVPHCKRVKICDDAYAHLSQEEIQQRQQYIQARVNQLAREVYEKKMASDMEETAY